MIISIMFVVLALLLTGFFAGIEIGSYSINKVRLRFNLENRKYNAISLNKNLKDPQIFIFTCQVGCNFAEYLASTIITGLCVAYSLGTEDLELIYGFFPWSSEVAATFILMLPILIFGEIIPKNLFRKNADTLMYITANLQRFFIILCLPFTIPMKIISNVLTPKNKDLSDDLHNLNMQKLKFFLSESKREGVISDHQNKMIDKTMLIHIKPLTDLMTGIEKAVALPDSASVLSCLQLMYNNKDFNRIPIYKDKKENIIGYVHFFDIMNVDDSNTNIGGFVKKITAIKGSTTIQQAFYEMQTKKEPIATVADAKGKTIGIIRLKEIVKHITGH